MQDSGTAQRMPRLVDIPHCEAYPRLVTKDTTVEHYDSERMDAADGNSSSNGGALFPKSENYYDRRHARFMAAMRGTLSLTEYVQEVVAETDRMFPKPPPALDA